MAKTTSPATAASATAWSSFSVVTAATILIFWVLFPFYSYQLQIIFDQKFCFDPESKDQYTSCSIPSKQNASPYCPDTECKESVKGPDMFTKFINSFGTLLKQVYTIITGVVWIEIDKGVTKMEHDLHNPKKKSESTHEMGATSVSHLENKEGGGARWERTKKWGKKAGEGIKKSLSRKGIFCNEKLGNDKTCHNKDSNKD